MVEKEKDKKKKSAFKSVTAVTKSWGNKLSPKLETKKVKSKIALMKVPYGVDQALKAPIMFFYYYFSKVYKLLCILVFQFSWPENFMSSF